MFAQIVAIASAFALTACGETNGNGGSNTGNTGNGDNTDITTTFGSLLRNRPRTKIFVKNFCSFTCSTTNKKPLGCASGFLSVVELRGFEPLTF